MEKNTECPLGATGWSKEPVVKEGVEKIDVLCLSEKVVEELSKVPYEVTDDDPNMGSVIGVTPDPVKVTNTHGIVADGGSSADYELAEKVHIVPKMTTDTPGTSEEAREKMDLLDDKLHNDSTDATSVAC